MTNHDVSNPTFNPTLRKFETSDPGHADIFNAVIGQLINNDVELAAQSSDLTYQVATGTATAITLTTQTLVNGYAKTFIASASNGGAATTINGKPLYKPGTTTAPTLISGKAYTVWYNSASSCFFIKASAEGTALASDVRNTKNFSNDNDTAIPGALDLSLLVSGNIRAGVTIDGIAGKASVVDTITGDATNVQILAGKKAFVNGALVTGTAVNKAAATITPSTVNQTIAANTLCTGVQTIAAITGTATDSDVVSGKTYNSATGILRTGAATIASLGGRQYASGTIAYTQGSTNIITFPFTPSIVRAKAGSSNYVSIMGAAFYVIGGSSYSDNISMSGATLTISGFVTITISYYAYG